MLISEKQIVELMRYLFSSLTGTLTEQGTEQARLLLFKIEAQQSEELKVIE